MLVAEGLAWKDEVRGMPQLRLRSLEQLAPEVFSTIIPTVLDGTDLDIRKNVVFATLKGAKNPVILFETESPENFAFNLFNGINSIHHVVESVTTAFGWEREKSYACVSKLFLRLVTAGICSPANVVGRSIDGSMHGADRNDSDDLVKATEVKPAVNIEKIEKTEESK
jgi:hypothetical protein